MHRAAGVGGETYAEDGANGLQISGSICDKLAEAERCKYYQNTTN
jgi:hypothetical protein